MKSWFGSKRVPKTVGSNPVSLSRNKLSELHLHNYVIGLKSDGVRYILFMCLRNGGMGTPLAVLIDRAGNMYEVEVMAVAEYFTKETILEGELVWRHPDEGAMLFLVFDAIRIKGESFIDKTFTERIEAVERCTRLSEEISMIGDVAELEARVAETDAIVMMPFDPLIMVRPKRFVSIEHTRSVWDARAEAQHRVDGLVIHRCNAAYRNGSATDTIFKWKPVHSVDLAGPPTQLKHASGHVDANTFWGRKVVILPSRVACVNDTDVAEYHIDVATDGSVHLFAMRTRPDKRTPNSLKVIQATLQDFLDNILPEEIAQSVRGSGAHA